MGELVYKHQNNLLPDIYDSYSCHKHQRGPSILYMCKIKPKSVYTSAKNELWQIQLDLPQPIIGIKYLNIQKMLPLSTALEMSLKFVCLHPKPENDILFSVVAPCHCVALFRQFCLFTF